MASKSSKAEFEVVFDQDIPLLKLPGRLSVLEAVEFKRVCQALCQSSPPPKKIVFDCSQTDFIDSCGVGALVSNFNIARGKGIDLVLQGVNARIKKVLAMTGLESFLTIEDAVLSDVEAAAHPQRESQLPTTHPSVKSPVKRLIDIVGSIVGLGITGVLFVPIAVAIKIDSPGPIFFKQTRCGWLGRRFKLWKFRSMCNDAERLRHMVANQASGAFFKNENDPRITRVGRFLRRTSLDELPQFWNVLRGEMSLVGTRPPTPNEVEIYEIPEWQRLDVKPGMTGEWQVNGRSHVKNFEDVIRLDLKYQQNWSLAYDMKLILKTIFVLFRKDSGAV